VSQTRKIPSVGAIVVASLGLAMSANQAFAGAVTAATGQFAKQFTQRSGAVDATTFSVLPNQTITTAAATQSGDEMTITLGGTAGAQITGTAGTLTCAGAGGGTWARTASTATSITFRSDGANAAGACTLGAVRLLNTALGAATAGQTLTLSASVVRGTTTVDSAPAATVATVVDQFTAVVATPWDGIVDYAATDGRQFTAAGDGANTDILVVTLGNKAATTIDDASLDATSGAVITINGDFSALNNTVSGVADGCANVGTDNGNSLTVTRVTGGAAIGTVSASCSAITITLSAADVATVIADASSQIAVNFNVNAGSTTRNDLAVQAFTGSAAFNWTVASSAVVQSETESTFAPGSTTASGSVVFVPYMPAGSGISQTLQIANNGARTGSVTMTARNQAGVACSSANMGGRVSIGANRVVDLGSMLAAGLSNCYGGAAATNKLFLTITVDVADTAVEVYSAYNVSGNRVNVVNSSNGRQATASAVGGGNSSR